GRRRYGRRRAAPVWLGTRADLRQRGSPGVVRGHLRIRPDLWVRCRRRVDRAGDLFTVASAAPREAQRHASGPRLFRTARPRPRPAPDTDFYRDGVCGTVDAVRAA